MRSVEPRTIKHVQELIATSGHWATVLGQYLTKLTSGFWSQEYLDSLFQLYHGGMYDLYTAYCFAHIHGWIGEGSVLCAKILVGVEPQSDKEIEINNMALSSLPFPFEGQFWGGYYDCDGYIKWIAPIEVDRVRDDGHQIVKTIDPGQVPLEVGFTKPDKTLLHIKAENGLARWPYNSKWIWLYVKPSSFRAKEDGWEQFERVMPNG